jgi:hypothetical protein
MRKLWPLHWARRTHGPAAAFARYKNLATPLLAPFPPSFLFNNPTASASRRSVLALHAHSALLPRKPTLSHQAPLIGHAAAEKDRASEVRGSFTHNPRSPLQLRCYWAAVMRIPSYVRLALAELRARQRPDPLAICLVVAPSPPLTAARSGDWDAVDTASPRCSATASRRNVSQRRGLSSA